MARYAVLIFEKVPPEQLPPDVMRGHMELPDRIAERGGRVVAGPGARAGGDRDRDPRRRPHRRAVHRDEGGARRHLHPGGARPRPRARARADDADRRRRRGGPAADRLRGGGGDLSAAAAVADAHRREWAAVLAATVRVTRDLDLAEEAVQDAYERALRTWPRDGVPERPGAWLVTVARRTALNRAAALPDARGEAAAAGRARRRGRGRGRRSGAVPGRPAAARLRLLPPGARPRGPGRAHAPARLRRRDARRRAGLPRERADDGGAADAREAEDRRGAHPVRGAGGRGAAGAARRGARRHPPPLRDGHTAPSGAALVRDDLARRALDLARMLVVLLPAEREAAGLLALLLVHEARRGDAHRRAGALPAARRPGPRGLGP